MTHQLQHACTQLQTYGYRQPAKKTNHIQLVTLRMTAIFPQRIHQLLQAAQWNMQNRYNTSRSSHSETACMLNEGRKLVCIRHKTSTMAAALRYFEKNLTKHLNKSCPLDKHSLKDYERNHFKFKYLQQPLQALRRTVKWVGCGLHRHSTLSQHN
jgi:hypothetical protein